MMAFSSWVKFWVRRLMSLPGVKGFAANEMVGSPFEEIELSDEEEGTEELDCSDEEVEVELVPPLEDEAVEVGVEAAVEVKERRDELAFPSPVFRLALRK